MLTADLAPTVTTEATDEALIAAAKKHNRSMDRHIRLGIEEFYRLGETLCLLFKRRHLQADGRWASVLKEVGISETTDRNARKFAQGCEFADLGLYRNKSDALRKLGIIADPSNTEKKIDDKKTADVPPSGGNDDLLGGGEEGEREDNIPSGGERKVADAGLEGEDEGNAPKLRTVEEDSLKVLSGIATRLEELAFAHPDADHLAQLDRIAAAVARLKGVGLAAA